MKKKFVFSIIIVSVIVIILASGIINKSYASEEIKQQKYSITENEEQKFLTNIYNTETETLKIKSINKEETDQNYISKEKSKTEILDNSNEQYIRNYFGNSENFDDGEYKGTLVISNIDIQNINNGYYEKIDENTYILSGSMPVYDVNKLLDAKIPEGDYDTLSGFLQDKLDRIPEEEENPIVETEQITYKIEEYEDKRILKVKACKNNNKPSEEEK